MTIDGEKAQDFDDAVSIRRLPDGGWLLGVHIADVSHYVRPGSPLDREAFERGTSVYFPDLTLPMLPERLSNGLCSLRPRVPRLTVSALMDIDRDGRVRKAEFTPSIIRTAHRMTYTSVFRIFEGDAGERARYADVVPDLLADARAGRGPAGAAPGRGQPRLRPRRARAHLPRTGSSWPSPPPRGTRPTGSIEEFMVAANVAVASAFTAKKIPAIYRVHPAPDVGDLGKLRDMLLHFGLALPDPAKVRSKDLQRVLEQAKGLPGEKFIGRQVLRAMKLAVYSTKNVGHYGLAKTDYTHFTSPIRRYPDLVVHRLLKAFCAGESRAARRARADRGRVLRAGAERRPRPSSPSSNGASCASSRTASATSSAASSSTSSRPGSSSSSTTTSSPGSCPSPRSAATTSPGRPAGGSGRSGAGKRSTWGTPSVSSWSPATRPCAA